MSQTTVQNRETIRYGSAKVLIGERFDKLTDIGAARSVAVKETISTSDIESDNAGVVSTITSEHKMEVSLDSLELNFENYFKMRGDIDNFESYDGETEVTKEYIVDSDTYTKNELIKVPFKSADGSEAKIVKVEKKQSTGNILLEEDTDYSKEGTSGIRITGESIKPLFDTLIITFSYTPPKMIRMTSGGKGGKIKPRCMMIINTNTKGKELRIYVPQASIANGLELSFPSDKAQDVMVNKLSFTATTAGSQKAGEQLAWYEDEQAVED